MQSTDQKSILIPGGSGLIGSHLVRELQDSGYRTAILSRNPESGRGILGYTRESFERADAIVNLAGESLSAGRWTKNRKQRIIDSRIRSLEILYDLVRTGDNQVKTLISASAIGYYGNKTTDRIHTESDPAGSDFLADVCRRWEEAARPFEKLGIRVVNLRIGVVFSQEGGALAKLMMPLKFGVSIPLGSGRQWLPWIHIKDLVHIIMHCIENEHISGPINAVSPDPVTNRTFMRFLARKYNRLFIPFGVPGFLLNLALGDMASVTLTGSRISSRKLVDSGFDFRYPTIEDFTFT